MDTDKEYADLIRERFTKLPKVVQDAITSADVSAHMRELAQTHKLHLDQWDNLENEVQLTLLGVHHAEELAKNIASEVGVDAASASALAADIFKGVFDPIREQLEHELEHPDSVAGHNTSATAPTPAPTLQGAAPATASIQPVLPATPPKEPAEGKVERAALSPNYIASQASHERKAIVGDPYREQLA